ncbi:DUF397 domain-containing protein [Haloactinomyces albus]|uniref:DUF397 domain-containing protein n=1 Tax=Haloactinomyces albus TaxID=1352928 RepID=A0AAE4CMF6_9ACTN|nr:DUF397 domain-containing protein [Haloactinomyces albus]MDR7303325.1 hypothetical protein [Haloactinomyces albus]
MSYEDALTALGNATNWHKSSRSQAQNGCVEVGSTGGYVGVRDSKIGAESPVLPFTAAEWAAFTEKAKAGSFDR